MLRLANVAAGIRARHALVMTTSKPPTVLHIELR